MRKIISAIFCLAFLSLVLRSQTTTKEKFDQMQWLVVSWKGMANSKPFYEAWRRVNDSVFVNFAIEITGQDTVVNEGIPIPVVKVRSRYSARLVETQEAGCFRDSPRK